MSVLLVTFWAVISLPRFLAVTTFARMSTEAFSVLVGMDTRYCTTENDVKVSGMKLLYRTLNMYFGFMYIIFCSA